MGGLYSASLLRALGRMFNPAEKDSLDLGRQFNLIAGTSTGAILACALATNVSLNEVVKVYTKTGPQIFKQSATGSFRERAQWKFKAFCGHVANPRPLEQELAKRLGDWTLPQVWDRRGIGLMIPMVDATSATPLIMKTSHLKRLADIYGHLKLHEICMLATAAPVYFPAGKFKNADGQGERLAVDGALWANNPSLQVLLEAMSMVAENPGKYSEIVILSICSPKKSSGFSSKEHGGRWGISKWLFGAKLLEMTIDAQSMASAYATTLFETHMNMISKETGHELKIKYLRLGHDNPIGHEVRQLGMDKAKGNVPDQFIACAEGDARYYHGQAKNNATEHAVLEQLLTISKPNQEETRK
jgi:patatin-like phospholipase/acyl hydrolase